MAQLQVSLVWGLVLGSMLTVAQADPPNPGELREAISKGIPLIEASAKEYLKQRECFSCHHQAMPMVMLSEAMRRGFPVDRENFQAQLDRSLKHLRSGKKQYLEGKGQGGRVDTAAWALWALESGEHAPDETTEAVAKFLIGYQKQNGYWSPPGNRPPTGASRFASTYVALRGLEHFGTEQQQKPIAARREKVSEWLKTAEPQDIEDRVYRLRTLHYLGADDEVIQAAVKELIELQHEDGGWSQTVEMASDAYATGTTLVALQEAGGIAVTESSYQRGLEYLIETQQSDGSWKVETRSRPIQTYFESGFPHKKGQFVSIAASSWAITAMLLTFPETELTADLPLD